MISPVYNYTNKIFTFHASEYVAKVAITDFSIMILHNFTLGQRWKNVVLIRITIILQYMWLIVLILENKMANLLISFVKLSALYSPFLLNSPG